MPAAPSDRPPLVKPAGANQGSAFLSVLENTPKAAIAGYKLFPVPEWNAESGRWDYNGQPYARKRPGLDSFVR